jgi:PmbA protein
MRAREDALFDQVFQDAAAAEKGPLAGAELYERRGWQVEVTEGDDGITITDASETGFALRLFRGGRTGFSAAGPDGARHLVSQAAALVPRGRSRRGFRAASPLHGEARERTPLVDPPFPDEERILETIVAFRRDVGVAGKGAVALREVSVQAGERRERIATTGGREASWESAAASIVATVAGRSAAGRFSARVVAVAARLEELPLARLARHAADRVLLPLTGQPAPGGKADLLLDPHVAAHLVGRLAPLFLGDSEEGLLLARTRGGRDPLTSPVLTIVDSASAPGGPVRAARDGEGTPTQRTILVERGRVVGRLTDVATALRTDGLATGNAIRTTWHTPPELGPTNFFIDPSGGLSPVDLLSSVRRGVYAAVLLERPEVDLAADQFRLVTAGYAIEQGRAAAKLSEIPIAGRLSELLRTVSGTGDDLKFVTGSRGGAGSPTLLVPRWKLG